LTNAKPDVAEFPHSTWKPMPGMAQYENLQFQLVDTPPITPEYMDPWMGDLIRRGDILALLIDLKKDPMKQLTETLAILKDLRVFPVGFPLPPDLKKSPFIKKMIVAVNKVDNTSDEEDFDIFLALWEQNLPVQAVSALSGRHVAAFLNQLYDLSGMMRVYTKAPGKKPDFDNPFVVPRRSSLEDLAGRIHKDFVKNLKFARIWGRSVFDGQMVQRDHVLEEGDVVEIHA
jgi:hypothetical protein